MLYEMKCWTTKKQNVDKMIVAKMRMLKWILRWFDHIQRRPTKIVVKRCDTVMVGESVRGRGKSKLT
ncbi:hypothetical protein ACSBR1_039460 [Camellia fascicularis]